MGNRIFFLTLILSYVLFGCDSNVFHNEEDLIHYLKDETNGYIMHKRVNNIDFTLMLRPTDLLVSQETEGVTNEKNIVSLRRRYGKYIYLNLSMSRNNNELLNTEPKNGNEFSEMVSQLMFGMGDKVHLYTKDKDTITLSDFIYPRMYGMSKATTIMFIYPIDDNILNNEYLNFVVEDFGLYTGEVKFKMQTEKILNQPGLSFKD